MTIDAIEIRPADEGDLSAFATDPDFGLLPERLDRRAAEKGELLVAREGGVPVGHVYIWDERADEPELRKHLGDTPLIMNLWVQEDRRRRGVGSKLMTKAEDWARERGHLLVALGVLPDNDAAIKLYLGRGYREWEHGEVKTHHDHYIDGDHFETSEICVIFVKKLMPDSS
ncbi:GNAT family N-acetyltransferase [Actinoplanes sp. TBRC 11911]|uniref:GNAT family N-acetyltransferase n=1 Tax=Actinoplanes sp. TBRC 11911 TaxID=2729386 RepID=UPI00145F46B4|nr:GNAT family N-acetyltransferase [Actinoplanes sp. TBRC 11911]NMO52920.1 GNAT family N-acetyltransferase [Actinoplanes sp. TBRC 11911]